MNRAQQVRELVSRAVAAIRQSFRATLTRSGRAGPIIVIQAEALAGEKVAAELMQHYGFASAPRPGADMIVIPVGGNSNHSVVVASEDARYRIDLEDGEAAIYSDEGDKVHLKRGRVIEIVTEQLNINAAKGVAITTPELTTTGNISANGDIADGTRSMSGDRQIFNSHTHPGDSGGTTGTPNSPQ